MRNKKMIPFEVIEKAVAGEQEAVDAVLRHYTCIIKLLNVLYNCFLFVQFHNAFFRTYVSTL